MSRHLGELVRHSGTKDDCSVVRASGCAERTLGTDGDRIDGL